ncbi:phasin family protein [Candidatus Odyssella thessalonicensis]|uniref:phasin family protein n=1 Tax=Candidatus Odyssella thessalonicensis TaxID=84647 RepID=UPI000225AF7A|nr:phasin family protein [Candidatus Odyssella thessalonicensis]
MSQNPFQSMQDMMKDMSQKMASGIDKESMMLSHRKNMEALTEANRMAIEVMKSITQLQSQYVKQTFEDMASIMKDSMAHPPASKEAVAKHANHVKSQVEKAVSHSKNVAGTIANSQKEIFDLMHKRYSESMSEMIDLREKNRTKH